MLKRLKPVISTALVAVLLLTLFPLASFAADPTIKFSVTKQTLTKDELDELDPDDENIGDKTNLYPVPLIVRVAVSGSGKLVGADFSVTYDAAKLEFARTINYPDSILDDTDNIAVSDPQNISGSTKKKINVSFFITDNYGLNSKGGSIVYLMFYVKKIPNTKFFYHENMVFEFAPEAVGYIDGSVVKVINPQSQNYSKIVNISVANNIIPDTPAPFTSLVVTKQPSSYAVNKTATSFRIPDSDILVYGRRDDGSTSRLIRDDSGLSSGYSVSRISLATAGNRTVTVTYKDGISGKTLKTTFVVKVVDTAGKTVASISVTPPTNIYNTVGKTLDTEGLKVVANYTDKTTATITNYTISGYNKDKIGEQTITISLSGKTATFKVYVCPNRGDIDNSGKIDAGDARLVLRYAAKLDKPNEAVIKAMDCDKDGKVNASDARKILRYVAKLDKTF